MLATKSITRLEAYAESIGVRIREAPVPAGWWGVYDHRHRLITLEPGLGLAQRRSTLAHELGHATYGHHGHTPKTELIADKWAARKLLNVDLLLDHAKANADVRELAANLEVMPWVIETFVDLLTESELRCLIWELKEAHHF